MGARIVMPLRIVLPCLAVCVAASGAAAIGVAGVPAAGGYVVRQADDGLRACVSSVLSHGLVAVPSSGPALPGACGMELLSTSGQMVIPASPGPAIPAGGSWLAAHLSGPATLPGTRNGGRWRVLVTAVDYQPQRMLFVFGPDDLRYVISGPAGHGSSGMLIVTARLAGTGPAAAGYAAAAGAVLVLLAAAAFALTRAILRPVRAAAALAGDVGSGTGGRPDDVMARLGVIADLPNGQYATMLARMRGRLQASHAAEAAARRSAADISEQLGQTCLQLRRPVSILHGFTEYCREQDTPSPARLDQMMRRVTDEISRIETLADRLHVHPADELPVGEENVNDARAR